MDFLATTATTVASALMLAFGASASKRRRSHAQQGGGDYENLVGWRADMTKYYAIPGATAADIGCGDLDHWNAFGAFDRVYCVDSGDALSRARSKIKASEKKFVMQKLPAAPGGPWNFGPVDVLYMFNTLQYYWNDPQGVGNRLARYVKPGGFVVACIRNPNIKPPYTVTNGAGKVILQLDDAPDDEGTILVKKMQGLFAPSLGVYREPKIKYGELIERMRAGGFVLAHIRHLDLENKQLARAYKLYVFMRIHAGVQMMESAYREAGITDFLFPGGISFNALTIAKKQICPLWLLKISDVDTNCICTATQRAALLKTLKGRGVKFQPPRPVGIYDLYADDVKDIDLGISLKPDPLRELMKKDSNGMLTERSSRLETSMFLYLSYNALISTGTPSHTRAFKIDKLAARMSSLAGVYDANMAMIDELRFKFQAHLEKSNKYDVQGARRFYNRHKIIIDTLARRALKDVDLHELRAMLVKYLSHTLHGVDHSTMENHLRAGGGGVVAPLAPISSTFAIEESARTASYLSGEEVFVQGVGDDIVLKILYGLYSPFDGCIGLAIGTVLLREIGVVKELQHKDP